MVIAETTLLASAPSIDNPINSLPDGVWCEVFQYVASEELRCTLPLVCKSFRETVQAHPQLFSAVTVDFGRASTQALTCHQAHQQCVACSSGVDSGIRKPRRSHGSQWVSSLQRVRFVALRDWLSVRAAHLHELTLKDSQFRGPIMRVQPRHDLKPEDLSTLLQGMSELRSLTINSCNDTLTDFEVLSSLVTLTRLHLLGCTLPASLDAVHASALGQLTHLADLALIMDPPCSEGLRRLPSSWSQLTQLTQLTVSGHYELARLPSWISQLTELKRLTLRSCDLTSLSYRLGALPLLTHLDLSRNPLGSTHTRSFLNMDGWMPRAADLGHLTALQHLSIADADILQLPSSFSDLVCLRVLDLSCNPLGPQDLASFPPAPQITVQMYLQDRVDRGLSVLSQLPLLEELLLRHCGLRRLPSVCVRLQRLRVLSVSFNHELCAAAEELDNLMELPGLRRMEAVETQIHEGHGYEGRLVCCPPAS